MTSEGATRGTIFSAATRCGGFDPRRRPSDPAVRMIPPARIRRALCHPERSVAVAVQEHLACASHPMPLRASDLRASRRAGATWKAFAATVLPRLPVAKHTVRVIRVLANDSPACAQAALLAMDRDVVDSLWPQLRRVPCYAELRHVVTLVDALAARDISQLWSRFVATVELPDKRPEHELALRLLLAAMARAPRAFGQRLCETLYFPERFSVELRIEAIRALRSHPNPASAEGLFRALELPDETALDAVLALGRLGTHEVVRRVVSGIRGREDALLEFGPLVLARTASREAECALVDLLREERSIINRTLLAEGVCLGFMTHGFSEVFAMVVRNEYAHDVAELDLQLWIAASATGWDAAARSQLRESARLTTLARESPLLVDSSTSGSRRFGGWN